MTPDEHRAEAEKALRPDYDREAWDPPTLADVCASIDALTHAVLALPAADDAATTVRVEHGCHPRPRPATVADIARAFDVPEHLLDGAGTYANAEDAARATLDALAAEVVHVPLPAPFSPGQRVTCEGRAAIVATVHRRDERTDDRWTPTWVLRLGVEGYSDLLHVAVREDGACSDGSRPVVPDGPQLDADEPAGEPQPPAERGDYITIETPMGDRHAGTVLGVSCDRGRWLVDFRDEAVAERQPGWLRTLHYDQHGVPPGIVRVDKAPRPAPDDMPAAPAAPYAVGDRLRVTNQHQWPTDPAPLLVTDVTPDDVSERTWLVNATETRGAEQMPWLLFVDADGASTGQWTVERAS